MSKSNNGLHLDQKKILVIDQIISASTNYFPLFFPLILNDLETLGEIAFFQSFYIFYIGISRAALGTSQIINRGFIRGYRLLLYGGVFSIIAGYTSSLFVSLDDLNVIPAILVFTMPILQDVLRFESISRDKAGFALSSDFTWLLSSILCGIFLNFQGYNLTSLLIASWTLGAGPSILLLLLNRRNSLAKSVKATKDRVSKRFIIRMGATGFISELNTITTNWIITFSTSALLLGTFRFYQLCFLPVAFLINVNRLTLIQMFKSDNKELSKNWLRKQNYLRIIFYICGVLVSLNYMGFTMLHLANSFLAASAVEFAFKRNIIYLSLMAIGKEKYVIGNLLIYLVISLAVFSIFAQTQIVTLLIASLFGIESFGYLLLILKLRKIHD
jgi:hypothetical protein